MNAPSAFIGQDHAWEEWQAALASDRMHHAWLLSGAKGLGKRAFARAAAAELVKTPEMPAPDPAKHPDIIVLGHLPKDEKEARKKADGEPYETKRNITVEQVREMQRRLTTRPTLGDKRAIIIDPADDLEKSAVNALLKSLEEPPSGTYFLLIAHQPGRLLPTIRSRCRTLRFSPLSAKDIDALIRRDIPEASAELRDLAIKAANGSPGMALTFVEHELAGLYGSMRQILSEGDADFALRGQMSQEIGARPPRERVLAALELARCTIGAELAGADRARQLSIIEAHGALTRLAAQAPTHNFDPSLLIMEIGGLLAGTVMPRETANQH